MKLSVRREGGVGGRDGGKLDSQYQWNTWVGYEGNDIGLVFTQDSSFLSSAMRPLCFP